MALVNGSKNFDETEKITLKIKDVGPIDTAKININKINIIGGHNSTGKSTSSKLLYSFLRANSKDKQELATDKLDEHLKFLLLAFSMFFASQKKDSTVRALEREFRHKIRPFEEPTFENLTTTFKQMEKFYEKMNEELSLDYNNKPRMPYDEFKKLRSRLRELDDQKDELLFNSNSYDGDSDEEIIKIDKELEEIKSKLDGNQSVRALKRLNHSFKEVKEFIEKIDSAASDKVYEEAMKSLLSSEFGIREANNYCSASLYGYLDDPFGCDINFKDYSFDTQGLLNLSKVFYFDSFSFFDFRSYTREPDSLLDSDHFNSLEKALFESSSKYEMFDADDENYKIMTNLEKMVKDIINGEIVSDEGTLKFVSNDGDYSSSMMNTASGIKQIAMIQNLLRNKAFKPNSFLILDEPEVNLHPKWQYKFAQILVLLAMVGNVRLYINTHSPLFISCIDTFTRYYEVTDSVNYYLTVPSEEQMGRYDFVDVPCDNLDFIFDNLGHPYRSLDMLDIKIYHKKEDLEFNKKE